MQTLSGTDDAAQAASIIASAAAQNGLEINQAELAQHFEEASKSTANQALSDSQLEAVAGGLDDDGRMALISVFTLGLGCAGISISQAIGGVGGTNADTGKTSLERPSGSTKNSAEFF